MSPTVLGPPADGEAEQQLINYGVLGGIVIRADRRPACGSATTGSSSRPTSPSSAAAASCRSSPLAAIDAVAVADRASSTRRFNAGLTLGGHWVTDNDVAGGFVYGTLNRLLIPLGLHHILNSGPWFLLGSYTDADGGASCDGDIARFLHGDPTAGAFMTGFFPIMMFALPAAALAIWHEAKPAHKKPVGGIMLSAALTSFLTGVTEPLEFAFMFVAWPLYVIHALLTGTSMALVNALGIKDGFGFSAGLFDYALNWNIATKPLPAHPDRAGLRRGLLLPVPLRDPQVEPARPRAARTTTTSRWSRPTPSA